MGVCTLLALTVLLPSGRSAVSWHALYCFSLLFRCCREALNSFLIYLVLRLGAEVRYRYVAFFSLLISLDQRSVVMMLYSTGYSRWNNSAALAVSTKLLGRLRLVRNDEPEVTDPAFETFFVVFTLLPSPPLLLGGPTFREHCSFR